MTRNGGSQGEAISDQDKAIWQSLGGDIDELSSTAPGVQETLSELLDEVRSVQSRLTDLERAVYGDERPLDGLTSLQQYARLRETDRADLLGASARRAVTIYEHWEELAVRLPNGKCGVSTKRSSSRKHSPSQFKLDLETVLGEELAWEQVYRAMKAVAKLSGGSSERDEYGRTHIVGGLFEFHVRTSPDNTDHTTYRVLIEA